MAKKLTDSKVDISGLEADTSNLLTGQDEIKTQNDDIKAQNDDIKSKNNELLDGQTDIEAKVDRLEVQNIIIISDTNTIINDTKYIRDIDAGGLLLATPGSVAYQVAENDRHVHSYARFFETASSPNPPTHVADELGYGNGPFQLSCGSNVFGSWVQVFGSSDTSFISEMAFFDFHEIQIEGAQRQETYIIQISFGETGDQGKTNGTYSTRPYTPQSILIDSSSLLTQAERQAVGTKVWMRGMVRGLVAGTLDFYPGFHEYEG
jgi:hypothetical protein